VEIAARLERTLYGLSLILAPLLLALSTFFWEGEGLSYIGGIIQVYSFVFWIPALIGLLSLLRPSMPRFSVWGILLVCWVCIAGNNFGMQGIYMSSLVQAGVDSAQIVAFDEVMGVAGIFVLYMPGLLFPLTIFAISFLLWRTKAISPLFALLLCLGAIAFPASRIPRIEIIAHLADLLLLIACSGIGWQFLQHEVNTNPVPGVAGMGDD
jgi:hypothetical protein